MRRNVHYRKHITKNQCNFDRILAVVCVVNIYIKLSIANLQISNLEFSHIPLRVFIYYQRINGELGQHPTRPQQIKHAGILLPLCCCSCRGAKRTT